MAYTGPFPHTNAGVTNEILVSGTTFAGSVSNSGTIGAGGIVVISSTLQNGGIIDTGTLAGGIKVDGHTTIIASGGTAIAVLDTTTLGGGISNSGIVLATANAY